MPMQRNHSEPVRAAYEGSEKGLDVWQYIEILKRRLLHFLIPFGLVAASGGAIVMLLPAIYVAEGKILVESQQIPTDLVRPTITANAKERIQIIEQRVMTRQNLLAIVNKFNMFADRREALSGTQLLDLMRQSTRLQPFELEAKRRDSLTIALTVGFEHAQPEMAMRVANELVTLILNEDARNRTSRAQETTNFLAREVKKLEGDLGMIEAQISEFKRKYSADLLSEKTSAQLAALKSELQEKSALYSRAHPEIIRLTRQIAALEKLAASAANVESGLEALQNQRAAIQKNLEGATHKLSAAQLGENLEKAQFSERLEVLEQAVLPQKPFKPNRPKMLLVSFALAALAGIGVVAAAETLNSAIHDPRDLFGVVDAYLIVGIPYISTKEEALRKKVKAATAMGALALVALSALTAAHFLVRPLPQLWGSFVTRLLG